MKSIIPSSTIPYVIQGLLIVGVGMMWVITPKALQFAVVDMNTLISQSSKELAKMGKTSHHQIQEFSYLLKEDLESLAQERQIILLAKGAVVGGNLPDITEEVLASIQESGSHVQ